MNEIEYFKVNETLSYQFYQMPKELFKNPYYKSKLSLEAKVAYTLILDRLQISRINKWFNENGEIYLIFTRLEIINELKISKSTASKIFRELSECNLIREERLGQGKPNQIFVGKIKCEDLEQYKRRIFGSLKNELQEVQDKISKCLNENTNNTDINNTNNIYDRNEKIFFDEKVSLYKEELKELVSKYSIEKVSKFVVDLNLYKLSIGKEYSSDYDAIIRWVINKIEKDEKKLNSGTVKNHKPKYQDYEQREYEDLESFYDNM